MHVKVRFRRIAPPDRSDSIPDVDPRLNELPVVPGTLHRDLEPDKPLVGIATDFSWVDDPEGWKYTVEFFPHELLVPGALVRLHPDVLREAPRGAWPPCPRCPMERSRWSSGGGT